MTNFLEVDAIRVKQSIGEFFVASIPVNKLNEIAYSRRLSAIKTDADTYELQGSQRQLHEEKLRKVGLYLDRSDATFPNSIILAANFLKKERSFETNDEVKWKIKEDGGRLKLIVPTNKKLAQIIDGQHRLFGFNYSENNNSDFELVCSIFFGLPEPMQAQVFATINSRQKPVPKSQTYELFGYNIEDETPIYWGPDKLSVFFARKLNVENDSPLRGKITVSAENDFSLTISEARKRGEWMLSLATVVDSVIKLISTNVDKDLSVLSERKGISRRSLEHSTKAPLREFYVQENDKMIYLTVKNYLRSLNKNVWKTSSPNSYIMKTVGFQASMDILNKHLCTIGLSQKNFSESFFDQYLFKVKDANFDHEYLSNASGVGRSRLRVYLELLMEFYSLDDIKDEQKKEDFAKLF